MAERLSGLTGPQWGVLQWAADGCPSGTKHDRSTSGNSAQALANRGLVTVRRGRAGWRVEITEKGAEVLRLRRYPLPDEPQPVTVELEPDRQSASDPTRGTADRTPKQRRVVLTSDPEGTFGAAKVRKIMEADDRLGVPRAQRERLALSKDVVYRQEVDMRFEVKITRVQVATRYVMASDQETAAEKIRAQLDESPYRMYANFETVGTEIEITAVEEQYTVRPLDIEREGPMLIPLADAARATGISYGQLSQLASSGSIEQVKVGSRRYLKRRSLLDFIERCAGRGWGY